MLSLMELMDYDPNEFEEIKEKKRKNKLCKKRLIAKRILIGSGLALAIGVTSGMISSAINQNKIANLRQEQDKMYEQYMKTYEFKKYADSQLVKLTNYYANGEISYDTFRQKLDEIYSTETADRLLESTNNELKDDIEQIEQQISDTKHEYNTSAVNIVSNALVGASLIAGTPSGIAFTLYDIKTVAKDKIAHQEYETGPVLIDKKSNKKEDEETLTK